jgi:putative phosphoesterase
MRIGIVSDTHNNLKNVARIVELFNTARVDRVIHTGDITQADSRFAGLDAPPGVFGNNDQERTTEVAIAERGFRWPNHRSSRLARTPHHRRPRSRDLDGVHRRASVALHGLHHHHRPCRRAVDLQPGECAGHMEDTTQWASSTSRRSRPTYCGFDQVIRFC